jgi:Predicted transcriptional regulator
MKREGRGDASKAGRRAASRPKREARLQWLDREIRAGNCPNAHSMATELGIAPRTAWKDFRHLRDELGAPVEFDEQCGGWRYADEFAALPLLYLTRSEAVALRHALTVARAYLTDAEVAPLGRVLERLACHVPQVLPSPRESAGGALRPLHPATTAGGTEIANLLDACTHAIERRHKLRFLYYGAHRDQETERVVRPYHLHNDRGEWYLIAHCELREDVRTFLLGRVREWRWAGEEAAYQIPADFDAEALIGRGFHLMHGGGDPVEVVLRFSPRQARWMRERRYHPTQRTEDLPDGGLLLRLTVTGLEDVRRWALSFGAEVEVLAPPTLRERLAAEGRRLGALYAADAPDFSVFSAPGPSLPE